MRTSLPQAPDGQEGPIWRTDPLPHDADERRGEAAGGERVPQRRLPDLRSGKSLKQI